MITVSEARRIILENVRPLGTEVVPLDSALGRVLAETVTARRSSPPLDNSAMDGFALAAADAARASEKEPVSLPVVRVLRAGEGRGEPLPRGAAVRIMTGAPIPTGADCVVPVEEAGAEEDHVILTRPPQAGDHVRRAGEDIRPGEEILRPGRVLRPADLGVLASQGIASSRVYRRAQVAVLATGDEVVDVGEVPREGQIYSSNSHTLAALVRECGAVPVLLGIARDDPEELAEAIRGGLDADALVTTGGISMGDYDYLKEVFARVGVAVLFWKVAQKPGKPMTFGTWREKPVFALPGNPVSTMISFELYVRPSLCRMMGHERLFRPTVQAVLAESVRKKRGRRNFLRGVVRPSDGGFSVRTTGEQGSGVLSSMSLANGIIILPEDTEGAEAGCVVEVYLLDSEEALASSETGGRKR